MAHTEAQPRYCPGCGGPNPVVAATACQFCQGPLVPVGAPDPRHTLRCPSCAAAVSEGSSFCGNCGRGLAEVVTSASVHTCPGCSATPMESFGLAPSRARPQGNPVFGCRTCGGVWVDIATLKTLLASAAAEASATGEAPRGAQVHQRRMASTKVVYRRCAVCNQHMQRRNFARVSGVIVDECRADGTFFDAGELEDVLAFVRSGGMALAAERDAQERAREARQRASMPAAPSMPAHVHHSMSMDADSHVDPIGAFVQWASRWLLGR